jgi:hypothetical protein
MENIFIVAAVISITYLIAKFIEMRFVEKENKPLKLLIRDSLLVYFSVITANFILEQLNPMIQSAGSSQNVTPIFTDNPGF